MSPICGVVLLLGLSPATSSAARLPLAFIGNLTSSALQVKFLYSADVTPKQMQFRYRRDNVRYLIRVPVEPSNETTDFDNTAVFLQWIDGLHSSLYYTICVRGMLDKTTAVTDEACVSMHTLEKAKGAPSIDIRGVALVLGMGVIIILLVFCGIGYEKLLMNCPFALKAVLVRVLRSFYRCVCCIKTSEVHPMSIEDEVGNSSSAPERPPPSTVFASDKPPSTAFA